MAGRAAGHPGRAALLLRAGDRHGPDAAGGVPPGAAPDGRADRVRHRPARPRPAGAGPLDLEPPGRDPGGAASGIGPERRARPPAGRQHRLTLARSRRVADGEARHHAAPVLAGGRRRSTAPRGAGPGASRISPRTPTPGGSSHRRSPARMPTTARRSAPCSSRSTVPSRPSPPTARPAAMTSTPRPRRAILTPTSSSHRARARCRAARARPLRRGGTAICEPSPGAAASDGRRPRGTVGAPWWSPTSRASSG